MRGRILAILGSAGLLVFVVLATSLAGAAPGPGGELAGVSDRKAAEGKSHKRGGGLLYDDFGRGAKASYTIISQWKWPGNPPVGDLTYCIQNGTADIAGTGENTAIKEALALWDNAEAKLSFTENCTSPKIIFKFAVGDHKDGDPFDGEGKVLAHADPPTGGIACFDDDEKWTLEERKVEGQPIDLLTVAAHEIGHLLGLGHSAKGTLMYEFYTVSHRFLSTDDKEGLAALFKSLTD